MSTYATRTDVGPPRRPATTRLADWHWLGWLLASLSLAGSGLWLRANQTRPDTSRDQRGGLLDSLRLRSASLRLHSAPFGAAQLVSAQSYTPLPPTPVAAALPDRQTRLASARLDSARLG